MILLLQMLNSMHASFHFCHCWHQTLYPTYSQCCFYYCCSFLQILGDPATIDEIDVPWPVPQIY